MLRERLVNLPVNNLRSTPRRALVSVMGVMIASCVLFMVVGHGFAIRALVTEKVVRELLINMLEVTPRVLDLGMFKCATSFDFWCISCKDKNMNSLPT